MSAAYRIGKSVTPITTCNIFMPSVQQINQIATYLCYKIIRKYVKRVKFMGCKFF